MTRWPSHPSCVRTGWRQEGIPKRKLILDLVTAPDVGRLAGFAARSKTDMFHPDFRDFLHKKTRARWMSLCIAKALNYESFYDYRADFRSQSSGTRRLSAQKMM
jgi:hypothetical protein